MYALHTFVWALGVHIPHFVVRLLFEHVTRTMHETAKKMHIGKVSVDTVYKSTMCTKLRLQIVT